MYGTEPHFHDQGPHRHEDETWKTSTSAALNQIEKELMALKGHKVGTGRKMKKDGKGSQGYYNYCDK